MGKIRRGNYQFFTWIGDHDHHVHVRKDNKQILKWDISNDIVLKGRLSKRLRKLLTDLMKEGLL